MGARILGLCLVAALAVAGCASREPAPDPRQAWLGTTYDEVVRAWGTPVRSATLSDGRQAYTWAWEGSRPRTGVSPSVGIGVGSGGFGIGTGVIFGSGGSEQVQCERTLIFEAGHVAEQNWQGPPEVCDRFGR
ncbi:MAG TPA: hypothetical protein VI319_04145 [Burkholderiales bacterium]